MKRLHLHVFSCILLLCVATGAARAEVIQAIRIKGNRQVSEAKIRRVIRIEAGQTFETTAVQDALKLLFATKQFDDLKAYREAVPGTDSVVVTIEVSEYPKAEGVRFEGNDHLEEEELDKLTAIERGVFVRPALVQKDIAAIVDAYKEKGYYRAQVADTLVQDPDDNVLVMKYVIDEGKKVSVKHVDFIGARALDTGDIRDVMETKEDRWYRGAEFKPKELEDDTERIKLLYRSRGFLDAEVLDKELIFSKDGEGLDIIVSIEEGRRYVVGDVEWGGNELFPDSVVARTVTLENGDVFDDTKFSQIQFDINSLYWDRGYIYSSVSPLKTVRDGNVIDVDFEITEGEPAHVHEINIAGNTKTSEEVIRRELIINPGDVFLRPRLMRSLREVFNLGFFAGPPEVSTTRANDEGDIDITLRVEEKPAGQFRLGAGFSELNKVSGFIGVTEPNFLGRGMRVGLDWEFSKYRQNINLQFTEPWLFGTPTELSVNVFNRIQNQVRQQFFTDRRTGFSISVGRPFPWFDYTSMFVRYRFEGVELSDFASDYTGSLRDIDWPQQNSSFGLTLLRNSTDNPFHPTLGTRTQLSSNWTGGDLLGGDVRFQRYEASFSWYQTLFWQFVLEVRDRVGILDGYDSPDQVPDYELYRLGGNRRYSLRGYDFYEVVPEGNPQFVGGRFMHTLTYEISYPIAPPTVYGLFFFDSGNTWNSFRGAELFDLKKGAGLGIRIELPMLGTVGLDYGYGFDRVTGGSWEPHITFGAGF